MMQKTIIGAVVLLVILVVVFAVGPKAAHKIVGSKWAKALQSEQEKVLPKFETDKTWILQNSMFRPAGKGDAAELVLPFFKFEFAPSLAGLCKDSTVWSRVLPQLADGIQAEFNQAQANWPTLTSSAAPYASVLAWMDELAAFSGVNFYSSIVAKCVLENSPSFITGVRIRGDELVNWARVAILVGLQSGDMATAGKRVVNLARVLMYSDSIYTLQAGFQVMKVVQEALQHPSLEPHKSTLPSIQELGTVRRVALTHFGFFNLGTDDAVLKRTFASKLSAPGLCASLGEGATVFLDLSTLIKSGFQTRYMMFDKILDFNALRCPMTHLRAQFKAALAGNRAPNLVPESWHGILGKTPLGYFLGEKMAFESIPPFEKLTAP